MNNKTMMQYFEWYLPDDQQHWERAKNEAKRLSNDGITSVWLPPAYKGNGGNRDVGYAVYDTYDLGEFNQKGSVATKYGTKDSYLSAIKTLQENNIKVLADIVFNHRIGADECEKVIARKCDKNNRNNLIGNEQEIIAWTKFNFPERNNKYSDFKWNASHFDGTDWDDRNKDNSLFLFKGKNWETGVGKEKGNYDYLMGADLDVTCPEVINELITYGKWYMETTGVDGYRIDAVKHIGVEFFVKWLKEMRLAFGEDIYAVGEYWGKEIGELITYLDRCGNSMDLFDVPLHFNFLKAATSNGNFDMRDIFKGTIVEAREHSAVTFVDNHDTQPGQALESYIPQWFKPLAYAITLLRQEGEPCVFYGDYYGIPHNNIPPMGKNLEKLLYARKNLAYGNQTDYIDDFNVIGFTREGDEEHKNSGLAVLISDNVGGSKTMCVGVDFAGKTFYDSLGNRTEEIIIAENGCAEFFVNGGSCSVYVLKY